ncbi:putative basic amino acid antiporter YfcC [Acetoanaerobium sticklandii]|uniref:putative basic amino acid antiporter YfcC n=1 Tax=Acetoanaerobium sticklandii TaxID=1511 RepID=UPI003A8F98EA
MSIKKNELKESKSKSMLERSYKVPDTYVIIFFVVLLAAVLTYVVPQGYFETKDVTYMVDGEEKTRTVVDSETFQYVLDDSGQKVTNGVKFFEPYGEVGFSNYMFEGLVKGDKWGSTVGIVAFILVIGGAFGIILKTGAVEAGILSMIKRTKGKEALLIPIIFFLFSLGGAVFGMGEEAIPFAMILVPLLIAMGYDAIVGIMITYVATQIGFATSWMNPFSVAIAQGVAGIPVLSGAGFRIVMWAVFTLVGIGFTWKYASNIKRNPTASVAYESDAFYRNDFKEKDIDVKFNLGHILVLLTILAGTIWVVWGVMENGYYIPEIATQFFVMGIVAGIIGAVFKLNEMGINDIASSFRDGAKDLVGAALVVGMAQGIILVLGGTSSTDGTVLNTILYNTSQMLVGLPTVAAGWVMYVFQSVFNFFVVSGSGQAALTMPLMAPLGDLVGVSRQVSVLAFQLGDGLTNLIVPTSGCLMGVLGVAKLDWGKWAKWQIKFQGVLFALATIFIIIAVVIGY